MPQFSPPADKLRRAIRQGIHPELLLLTDCNGNHSRIPSRSPSLHSHRSCHSSPPCRCFRGVPCRCLVPYEPKQSSTLTDGSWASTRSPHCSNQLLQSTSQRQNDLGAG